MTATKRKQSHWPLSVLGGLTSILNTFLPLSLVRVFTPNEIGQYKVFFLYVSMIPLVGLTMGVANGLFYWAGHADKRLSAFRSSWTVVFSVALIILALGSAFHIRLEHWLQWSRPQVWLFIFAAFFTVISTFYEDTKIATGEIWRGALFSSGFEATRNILIIICAMKFRTIDSVLWTFTILMGLKALSGIVLGHIDGFQRVDFNRSDLKAIASYAAPVSVAGLLTMFTGYGDQLLLSGLLPAAQFAIYSLGCLAVPPLSIFEISVNRVLIPNMSHAFSEQNTNRARELYRESIKELAWLLIPASIALSLFAKPIVLLLFREKYIEAADYLRIFAFSYLALILPYDVVARARGNGTWVLNFLLIFAPISMGAVYLGASLKGAMGTLAMVMLVRFAMRFTSVARVSKQERWKLSDMIPGKDLLRYTLISCVAAAGAIVTHYWVKTPLLWLIVGGLVYSLIYFAGTINDLLRHRKVAPKATPAPAPIVKVGAEA